MEKVQRAMQDFLARICEYFGMQNLYVLGFKKWQSRTRVNKKILALIYLKSLRRDI